MNKNIYTWIFVIVFLFFAIRFTIWYELLIWNECRLTNSVLYCMKMVSR